MALRFRDATADDAPVIAALHNAAAGAPAVVTVLRLARKKPWAIDVSYFTPVKRPL